MKLSYESWWARRKSAFAHPTDSDGQYRGERDLERGAWSGSNTRELSSVAQSV
jgi:hypothetical protein